MPLNPRLLQTITFFAHLITIPWQILKSVFGFVSRTGQERQRQRETDTAEEEARTTIEYIDLEAAGSIRRTKQGCDGKEGAGRDPVEQMSVHVAADNEKTSPCSHPTGSEYQHILPHRHTPNEVQPHTPPPQPESPSVHDHSSYPSYNAIALSSTSRNSPRDSFISKEVNMTLDDAFRVHDSGYYNNEQEIAEQQSSFAKGLQYTVTPNFRFPCAPLRRTKAQKRYQRRTMPDYLFSKTKRELDDVFANHGPPTSSNSAPSVCSDVIHVRRRPLMQHSYFSPDISPQTSPSCYSRSSWHSAKSGRYSNPTNVLPAWRSDPERAVVMFGNMIGNGAKSLRRQSGDFADLRGLNSFEKMVYEMGVVVEREEGDSNDLFDEDVVKEVDSLELEHRRFTALDSELESV